MEGVERKGRGRNLIALGKRTSGAFVRGVKSRRRSPAYRAILLLLTALCAVSCTANLAQIRQENATAVLSMYRSRPLTAVTQGKSVLTLDDCVRVALDNSLDLQTALWEEQVKNSLASSAKVRMLPRIEGYYELTRRDRPMWSRSDVMGQEGLWEITGPLPGTGVTNFSTARERGQRQWNGQIKWSPMDACMAKYLSDVKHNEAIYSRYQRVRVAQQLVGTVTGAFYRLMALTEALPKVRSLEGNRRSIVRDLAALDEKSMVDKQELITARTLLTEASSQLAEIYVSIEKQKELLMAAMNVSPCSGFALAGALYPAPQTCLDPCKLEADALVNRPEAYQADLTFINSLDDHKRLMVKLFPRVDGYVGYFRDENKFLENKNWIDGGMRMTWDLMDFAATLLEKGAAQEKIFKTDQERALISMGILSQVKMRTLDAIHMIEKFKKSSQLRDQASETLRIAKDVEEARDRGAPERVIRIARQRALCTVLQAEIDQLMALGDVHASFADLAAAVGSNYSVAIAHPAPGGTDPLSRAAMGASQGLAQMAEGAKRALNIVGEPVRQILAPLPKPW